MFNKPAGVHGGISWWFLGKNETYKSWDDLRAKCNSVANHYRVIRNSEMGWQHSCRSIIMRAHCDWGVVEVPSIVSNQDGTILVSLSCNLLNPQFSGIYNETNV